MQLRREIGFPITRAAQAFNSRIVFEFRGETADATEIIEIISLGVAHGDTVKATISGEDREAAMARIEEIFALNFNDS